MFDLISRDQICKMLLTFIQMHGEYSRANLSCLLKKSTFYQEICSIFYFSLAKLNNITLMLLKLFGYNVNFSNCHSLKLK